MYNTAQIPLRLHIGHCHIVQSKVLVVCRVVVVAPDAERTEQPGKALLLSNSAPTALPDAGEQLYTGV